MPNPYRLRSKKASAIIITRAMVAVRHQWEIANKYGIYHPKAMLAGGRSLAVIELMEVLGIPMKQFWNYANQFKVEISPKTMGMPMNINGVN